MTRDQREYLDFALLLLMALVIVLPLTLIAVASYPDVTTVGSCVAVIVLFLSLLWSVLRG